MKDRMLSLMEDADFLVKGYEKNIRFSREINRLSGLDVDANIDPTDLEYTEDQLKALIIFLEDTIEYENS